MAVKQLMLRMKLNGKKKELDDLRAKDAEFLTRKAEIDTREAALATAIDEANTDEEKAAVETEGAAIETDQTALDTDQTAQDAAKTKLSDEIADLERQLSALDANAPKPAPAAAEHNDERTVETHMTTRMKFFGTMSAEQRSAIMERTEVKDFLQRVREMKRQSRAVTNADLNIPDVFLEILHDNMYRYSKLIKFVNLKAVSGRARQTVSGTIPEAIWTEAVEALNELAFAFNQVEVDGYMVGGYIAVPNATLEDNNLALANEIMDMIGQSIGLAVDKAILYGNRSKMLMGIATRLAQTSKPSGWPAKGLAWADLHTSNLLKINPTGMTAAAFFAALLADLGVAAPNYSVGNTFWAMNRKTRMALLAQAVTFNAAGALVAGVGGTMPIEGGDIVELPFIPDNDIIGGFGSLYLLAERAGAQLAMSDQVLFLQNQTAFKGVARYDGMPVRGEAFIIVNIANSSPTTTVQFPQDVANTVATPKALPIAGAFATSASIGLACDTVGASIYYTVDGSAPDATKTLYNGPIAIAATTTIKAIAIKDGMNSSAVLTATYTKSN
jgi:HK97 family phage major capsid protein